MWIIDGDVPNRQSRTADKGGSPAGGSDLDLKSPTSYRKTPTSCKISQRTDDNYTMSLRKIGCEGSN
jgi:hypothetical protein